MAEAIIFTGIQASGKSSYYHENFSEHIHINLDTLKTRNREKALLDKTIAENKDFVSDNTNPTPEDRKRYILSAKAAGYTVIGYYFSSSVSECIGRNRLRSAEKRIPDIAVAATHKKLVLPSYEEGFDRLYYVRLTEKGFITSEWSDEK